MLNTAFTKIDDGDYTSFGVQKAGIVPEYSFTGKKKDLTGLVYFNARYYDAGIGRFISLDLKKDGKNWYLYCSNNPLRYLDINGHEDLESSLRAGFNFDFGVDWFSYGNTAYSNGDYLTGIICSANSLIEGTLDLLSLYAVYIALPSIWEGVSGLFKKGTNVKNATKVESTNFSEYIFKEGEASIHFEKHGSAIGKALGCTDYTLANYVADANQVIQNGQFVPEMNGYVRALFANGKANYAFVGLDRLTGQITTFGIRSVSELIETAPSLGLVK